PKGSLVSFNISAPYPAGTTLSGRVTHNADWKGDEMSKGNFLDFAEEIARDKSQRDEFFERLYKPGVTQEQLLTFFKDKEYTDVSLDDCNKMLTTAAAGDIRKACDFDIKY
ncbi:MAG: hypothetical protein V2B18_23790, partial [Pseudomonadota bacterium]